MRDAWSGGESCWLNGGSERGRGRGRGRGQRRERDGEDGWQDPDSDACIMGCKGQGAYSYCRRARRAEARQ